ncbi:MAG: hypothetical protein IIA61_13320 [Candidatus Marinimicrobia bacterium]|nr:hypothetical protein [Candidatus Neomarinimicrobiota bacterium]
MSKKIIVGNNRISKEKLQLPFVHYTSSTILAFSEKAGSEIYLCFCFKNAVLSSISNRIEWKRKQFIESKQHQNGIPVLRFDYDNDVLTIKPNIDLKRNLSTNQIKMLKNLRRTMKQKGISDKEIEDKILVKFWEFGAVELGTKLVHMYKEDKLQKFIKDTLTDGQRKSIRDLIISMRKNESEPQEISDAIDKLISRYIPNIPKDWEDQWKDQSEEVILDKCIIDMQKYKIGHLIRLPKLLNDRIGQIEIKNAEEIFNYILFKDNLCHVCNNKIPNYYYCHEMYGSLFKQNYGWYINKKGEEWGISHGFYIFHLSKECPSEITDQTDITNRDYILYKNIRNSSNASISEKRNANIMIVRFNQQVWKIVENEVRSELGYKKIGEGWTHETMLFKMICSLFPQFKVEHHLRPKWLNGQELDIYIQ